MKYDVRTVTVIALMTMAGAVFATTLVRAVWYSPETEIAPPAPATQQKAAEEPPLTEVMYPARLIVPSLSIDADVQYVGINEKGNMASPSGFSDVGWYKYGTVPGRWGSAVVAGHLDNGLSLPGVFKRLNEMRVGDEIYVETQGGERIRFVVSEIQSYDYTDVPADALFNRSDAVRLNLVTCDGGWIAGEKTYERRLVVYAVRAASTSRVQ